jgi:hypothetical protein
VIGNSCNNATEGSFPYSRTLDPGLVPKPTVHFSHFIFSVFLGLISVLFHHLDIALPNVTYSSLYFATIFTQVNLSHTCLIHTIVLKTRRIPTRVADVRMALELVIEFGSCL